MSFIQEWLKKMAHPAKLKAIGYWWSEDDWTLPHPQSLVQPDWQGDERDKIVRYLKSGHKYVLWLGDSWCRFDCSNEAEMGDTDMTDGTWIWPEGLGHYVEQHGVRLPDELVATMRLNAWMVPDSARLLEEKSMLEDWPGDCSFWLAWCRRQGIPLQGFWSGLLSRPYLWGDYVQATLGLWVGVGLVLLLLFLAYLTAFHGLR